MVLLVIILLLSSGLGCVSAQSDDITLIGDSSPLFFLEKSFSASVITSENEDITISIHDISVEQDRVLLRFYATGLGETWKSKITDNNRLYGSYLPVAEIVLDNGKIYTPSSLSKYSFLEYNGELIIGGLLVFLTEDRPQAFYLNFNQIPFDTGPLSEGFTKAVILSSNVKESSTNAPVKTWSVAGADLEFTLAAAAQTPELTMLQPTVRLERPDEILSKFGWITLTDPSDGKRYAVTRGNLYGFNLADDSLYSPAHSYVFSALTALAPVQISMDHAYIVREFEPAVNTVIDLNGVDNHVIHLDEEFELSVKNIRKEPDTDRIRLYFDSGSKPVADISFKFDGISDIIKPSVSCGIDPENNEFACDIYFDDISFPLDTLTVGIDAVEYRKEGPWTIFWTPVPMEKQSNTSDSPAADFPFIFSNPPDKIQPKEIRNILDRIEEKNTQLTETAGWIHEVFKLNYEFSDNYRHDLIPEDQYEMYFTRYISENWYQIDEKGHIHAILNLVRDPDNELIQTAQIQRNNDVIDLIHALYVRTNQPIETAYSCFTDFIDIADSSAVFLSEESCSRGNTCINFFQSLTGLPTASGSQMITFELDRSSGLITRETIDYDSGRLKLTKDFLMPEKTDTLPEEVLLLMDSVK